MTKTLTTFAAAAAVAAAVAAAPTDANAQWRRGWGPGAVGLGIVGGIAAGAIVGSAIANSYGPAYVVQPGYVPYAAYGGPVPVARLDGERLATLRARSRENAAAFRTNRIPSSRSGRGALRSFRSRPR